MRPWCVDFFPISSARIYIWARTTSAFTFIYCIVYRGGAHRAATSFCASLLAGNECVCRVVLTDGNNIKAFDQWFFVIRLIVHKQECVREGGGRRRERKKIILILRVYYWSLEIHIGYFILLDNITFFSL